MLEGAFPLLPPADSSLAQGDSSLLLNTIRERAPAPANRGVRSFLEVKRSEEELLKKNGLMAAELQEATKKYDTAVAENQGLLAQLQRANEGTATLVAEKAGLQASAAELAEQLAASRAASAVASEQLAAKVQECADLSEELSKSRDTCAALSAELAKAKARAAALAEVLEGESGAEHDAKLQAVDEVERRLEEEDAFEEELCAMHAEADRQLAELHESLHEARRELADEEEQQEAPAVG